MASATRTARRIVGLTITVILAGQIPCSGWDSLGHMAVAYVAYQQLDQRTKDRADALLQLNPDRPNWLKLIPKSASADKRKMMIFMIAATWPDRIKFLSTYSDDTKNPDRPDGKATNSQNIGYSDLFKHRYWHFIDTPFTQDGAALEPAPDPNAQTRIILFRQVIASNEPDELKSYDLSWLIHLVGDVHQPLHCASRFSQQVPDGDQGGNLVQLCAAPCKDELHAFWDNVLGTSESPSTAITVAKKLPPAGAGANDLDTGDWIAESVANAKSDVYVDPPIGVSGDGPFTLTSKYKAHAKTVAQARVALAGARLAQVLNAELK